ncbi:MAG: hypothetical protein KIC66_14735 [Clostridium sp.]|uniref:hypothetical protein n=1 Tax=Clostridium sp. TaxID=1506 RepID=UPI0025B879E8|nr:hypothetical protein [Clostridium sp.]MBS5928315.1 hypothetical protein [Clostridium sp.]
MVNYLYEVSINGVNVPVLECGYGNKTRIILLKSIAEIYGSDYKSLLGKINTNKEEFEGHYYNLRDEVTRNSVLKNQLKIHLDKRTVYFYALDIDGFQKLMFMQNKTYKKNIKLYNQVISKYFNEDMRQDNKNSKFLDSGSVGNILGFKKKNELLKIINSLLLVPKYVKNNNVKSRKNFIKNSIERISVRLMLDSIGVEHELKIPKDKMDVCIKLFSNAIYVEDEVLDEIIELSREINDEKCEYLKILNEKNKNQLKKIKEQINK